MKRGLLFLQILLTSASLFAQHGFFTEASAGYTFIPSHKTSELLTMPLPITGMPPVYAIARIKEYYEAKPSFEFTLGIHKPIWKNLGIETGLGMYYLGYERKTEISDLENLIEPVSGSPLIRFENTASSNDAQIPIGETQNRSSIWYAKMPLNVNYSYKKMVVGAGVSMSVLLYSKQRSKGIMLGLEQVTVYDTTISSHWGSTHYDSISIFRSVPTPYEIEEKGIKGLTALRFAGNISVRYNVYKKLWINVLYFQSFSPIYTEKYRIAGKAKNRSVMIGLRYDL